MYVPCDEDVYVELCDEDREAGEENMCGKLSTAMYGTRIAAKTWQHEAGNTLKDAGFTAGRTSPCLFHHPARDMMVFLHGDDFVSLGSLEDLKLLEKVLSAKYYLFPLFCRRERGSLEEGGHKPTSPKKTKQTTLRFQFGREGGS